MYKRIVLEEWQNLVPLFSFAVTFGIFACAVIRAIFLKKERADRLSRLPFEESELDHDSPSSN